MVGFWHWLSHISICWITDQSDLNFLMAWATGTRPVRAERSVNANICQPWDSEHMPIMRYINFTFTTSPGPRDTDFFCDKLDLGWSGRKGHTLQQSRGGKTGAAAVGAWRMPEMWLDVCWRVKLSMCSNTTSTSLMSTLDTCIYICIYIIYYI